MVETSVAVATPPPTAPRMMKGRTSAGAAISAVLPMTRAGRAAHALHVLAARLPAGEDRERQQQHHGDDEAGIEQPGDRDAGDRAEHDQHDRGRHGVGHGRAGGEQRDQFLGLVAAPLHLGEERGRDGRHVGDLGAGDARDQEERAEQHIGHAGADMAEHARRGSRRSPCPCRWRRGRSRAARRSAPRAG